MGIPLRQYARVLARYLRSLRRRVLILAVMLAALVALQLANPQVVRAFLDAATAGEPLDRLLVLAGAFLAIALLVQGLNVGATWLSETIGWNATNALRADLFDHCLRLDMSFHKSRTPGEMIQRIDGDVDALSLFFSQFAIQVVGNSALMLGVLALLWREDWRIGLAMTTFSVVAFLIMLRIRSIAVPRWTALREVLAQFYGFLAEHLDGTEDIQANGARPYVMRRFHDMTRRWLPLQMRSQLAGTYIYMVSIALFGVGNAIALGLGAYLWSAGAITVGTVYLVFHYTELLRAPIEQIRTQLQELQSAEASIRRVEGLLQTTSRLADGPGAEMAETPASLVFDGVSFEYDVGEPVLHDVSFRIGGGRVLGVLGRTGSGKTTAARLLSRLYDPTAGRVLMGGVDLRDMTLAEVRRRVGIVSQDVQVFSATVRDNLTFFDPSVPDERLVEALREVGLEAWSRFLARGLDTEIDADALSAGEAQLLALARVFLRDPALVVLDEASSRLDPASERLVEQATARLLEGRTAVIIAHRLATVERVDQVLVLEDGRIVEQGERTALQADGGSRYSRLLQAGMEALLA